MLDIVGGTYLELCKEPFTDELFGSGLRAAIATTNKSCKVNFHTYCGVEEQNVVRAICSSLDIKVTIRTQSSTYKFTYEHPLADPTIYPLVTALPKDDIISCESENIVVFGMLEGNAIIKGRNVVYDPQSPGCPLSFWSNGSNAKNLIVILNRSEANRLAGSEDWNTIKDFLLVHEKAKAAIVKCGAEGAIILRTGQDDVHIPAFQTSKVWSIGSGDIFTSTFSYFHLIEHMPIEEAATSASRATAYYTNGGALPMPAVISSTFKEFNVRVPTEKSVYLAGPFFTMPQRWMINQCREALRSAGLKVFSPLHDVGFGAADLVAPLDIEAIKRCDFVFAVIDGLDSGTLFEVGYARAIEKPVIAFVENEPSAELTMLIGSDCLMESDFTTAVYKAVWEIYRQ